MKETLSPYDRVKLRLPRIKGRRDIIVYNLSNFEVLGLYKEARQKLTGTDYNLPLKQYNSRLNEEFIKIIYTKYPKISQKEIARYVNNKKEGKTSSYAASISMALTRISKKAL